MVHIFPRSTLYSFFPIFLIGTVGLSGFTPLTVSSNSDDFFSRAFDTVRVSLAENDVEKTKVKIGIAREYTNSLAEDYDQASIDKAQQKVNDALEAGSDIQGRVREKKLTVETPVLMSLISDMDNLLVLYQERLNKIQIVTSQDVLRARVKKLSDRITGVSLLLKSDREDLSDDGILNASSVTAMAITAEGDVTKDGSILQIGKDGSVFHLVGLPTMDDQQTATYMRVGGILNSSSPDQLVVTQLEQQVVKKDEQKTQEVIGTMRPFGKVFIVVGADGHGYVLSMTEETMDEVTKLAGKFVRVKGNVLGDILTVESIDDIHVVDTKTDPFQATNKSVISLGQ